MASNAKLPTLKEIQGRPGRPPAILAEHLPKIEKLAALGLNDSTIAKHLGVHPATFAAAKNGVENSEISQAMEKGRLQAIERVAQRVDDWAAKNPIVTMYQAKAILGRHDDAWRDSKAAQADIKVEIKIIESSGPQATEPAIDAEYSEVDE